ncbi:DUF7837 family putative zinc-binding protein [Halosimplex halophilum]|uniref:DUF7837 family putative zinc-binding protein n=1 Tax=Halosimplex halophilum TaxID=2559572 RepID=UPI0014356577|nr:hypothetical protein [Halosimplex halophilum]
MAGTEDRELRGETLGACPNCEVMIPSANLLIRYDSEGDWPKLFAECPNCEKPVHPE